MKCNRGVTIFTVQCILCLLLVACSSVTSSSTVQPATADLEPSRTQAPPTLPHLSPTVPPPTATETTLPVSPTPLSFPWETPQPGTVVLDFVAQACRAKWANGAVELPCPGNPDELSEGYITPASHAVAEGGIQVEAPLLIGLPGSGGVHGAALFGIYPALTIESGDTFHAVISCQEGTSCEVEFALEYFDAQGKYQPGMGWSWTHRYGGGPVPVQVDLSPLAGQSVQLTLVVRDQGTPQDDWVLWIYPYIAHAMP